MSFVVSLSAGEFDSVWSSLSSWLGKRQLSLCLASPLLLGDRRSRYVCVLVWFRLRILVFILNSVLCSIPNRLSNDCFGAHPVMGGMWELGDGEAVCFRLISLFFFSAC